MSCYASPAVAIQIKLSPDMRGYAASHPADRKVILSRDSVSMIMVLMRLPSWLDAASSRSHGSIIQTTPRMDTLEQKRQGKGCRGQETQSGM